MWKQWAWWCVIIIVLNAIDPFIYSSIHLSIYHRNGMLWRRTSSAISRKECSEWMTRKYTTLRKVRTASENGDSNDDDDDDDDDDYNPYMLTILRSFGHIELTWCLVFLSRASLRSMSHSCTTDACNLALLTLATTAMRCLFTLPECTVLLPPWPICRATVTTTLLRAKQ